MEKIPLGKTDIYVPPLGIGAWAWGDRFFWNYGRDYREMDVRAAFQASLAAGINFFDTAESYGQGLSERLLGSFIQDCRQEVIVATKFTPYPWRLQKGQLLRALQGSLRRLDLARVDLYQVHFPYSPLPVRSWAKALAMAVERGLARSVGVSNFSVAQMRRAYEVLAAHGIPLASNQVSYSLLNRKVEYNGLLRACQELGVTLIAYSPLAQGLLTGQYSPEKPPSGYRRLRYTRSLLAKVQPLIRLMREIGRAHENKNPAQIALNWLICKGTVPIPGAKNARQAQENIGALGWKLSQAEVAALDEASANIGSGP